MDGDNFSRSGCYRPHNDLILSQGPVKPDLECFQEWGVQQIPHPSNSPSIKSRSLQFRGKNVVGNSVKGLTEVPVR